MSFLLMNTPDPNTLRQALPSFHGVSHIFLPVNDNRNVEVAAGGSHWSLLLVSVVDRAAFHYDSLCDANEYEARLVAKKLAPLLASTDPLHFENMSDSPQQGNGSDCGVFVCMEMEYLLFKKLLRTGTTEHAHMTLARKEFNAFHGRRTILKVVEALRKQQQRKTA